MEEHIEPAQRYDELARELVFRESDVSLGKMYNHYSLLGTIEHLWNLGCLANTCALNKSALLTPLFEG